MLIKQCRLPLICTLHIGGTLAVDTVQQTRKLASARSLFGSLLFYLVSKYHNRLPVKLFIA